MYMVYWTEVIAGRATPQARDFETQDMSAAMQFMESLRQRQLAGDGIRFVTMSSEHPDSVGRPGVDVTGPDYNWKKRRA